VQLADVDRLGSIPDAALARLGERLRAAGLPGVLARLARVGERLDDALRAPMRVWNARRMSEPAAAAARLFVLHDAVTRADAEAVLGDLGPLMEGGMLEAHGGEVGSRVHLAVAGDVCCFGDRAGAGADAVPPMCGGTLELVRAAMPRAPVEAALDLGCGAGAVGLLLARAARRVVATDVSARALAYARFNAAVNGAGNVEHRLGDLYEPVAGARFDRIAAHPPFLAAHALARASAFAHGGARGDEIALRVLAGAPARLSAQGRAVVAADWPLLADDPLDGRARAAVGPQGGVDVLVLQSPAKNLDEYCAMHAAVEHGELGAAFALAATAHRDHLEALALRGIAFACVVVARGAGWTALVPVRHTTDAPVTAEAIDRIAAARALLHQGPGAIARARLRLPEGARILEQPMPDGAPPAAVVQLPPGRPEWPPALDASTGAWLRRIAAGEACTGEQAVAAAREGLLRGALDVDQNR
jgi:SAM-dependent methyltransferase